MAAGSNGVTATVAVTSVADTSRRLGERDANVASVAYDGMLELASKTLGLTTEAVKKVVNIDFDGLKALTAHSNEDVVDHTRRSLAVTQVKIDYTITVAVNDNTAIGDVDAIKVRTTFHQDHMSVAPHPKPRAQLTSPRARPRPSTRPNRPFLALHSPLLRPGRRRLRLRRRRSWRRRIRDRPLRPVQARREHHVQRLPRLDGRRFLPGREREALQ